MGLHEVKMTPEEVDAHIASRITDLADSIINIKKYVEMLENKPMVRKDAERCDNTIDYLRDAIMLGRHFIGKTLGEPIFNSIDKSFHQLFDAGERQEAVTCARRMIADGMLVEKIVKYTNLSTAEVSQLSLPFDLDRESSSPS